MNSATKYPSIDTYHELDPSDGTLKDAVTYYTGPVLLTEKIDGANGRIVVMPGGDWFIGSREEFLYARGDRVFNSQLGIVQVLEPIADAGMPSLEGFIQVFYLEVYGHRIGQGGKNYSTSSAGYRLFDIARVPVDVITWPREKIASWRDHGGQQWASEEELQANALPKTPRLATVQGEGLPAGIQETLEFLRTVVPATEAALDSSGRGVPEGIVLRSQDRKKISKAKYRDYERTLRARAQKARLCTSGPQGLSRKTVSAPSVR